MEWSEVADFLRRIGGLGSAGTADTGELPASATVNRFDQRPSGRMQTYPPQPPFGPAPAPPPLIPPPGGGNPQGAPPSVLARAMAGRMGVRGVQQPPFPPQPGPLDAAALANRQSYPPQPPFPPAPIDVLAPPGGGYDPGVDRSGQAMDDSPYQPNFVRPEGVFGPLAGPSDGSVRQLGQGSLDHGDRGLPVITYPPGSPAAPTPNYVRPEAPVRGPLAAPPAAPPVNPPLPPVRPTAAPTKRAKAPTKAPASPQAMPNLGYYQAETGNARGTHYVDTMAADDPRRYRGPLSMGGI